MKGGSLKHPRWTESEDAILTAFYRAAPTGGDFVVTPLIQVLKRSKAAIQGRANELGVTFKRGKQPRRTTKPYVSKARFTAEERAQRSSARMKERHATTPHPLLGKPVSQEVRDKISGANKGRKVTEEEIARRMLTRARNGTVAPNHGGRSWKAGWREVGGKRFYARSRWEANYARYLELLKQQGAVTEWHHEPETFWFEKIRRGARSYLPDFRVQFSDGRMEFHECKGWMDSRSRTKIRRMRIYHPKVVLRVIGKDWFLANNKTLRGVIPDWEHESCHERPSSRSCHRR